MSGNRHGSITPTGAGDSEKHLPQDADLAQQMAALRHVLRDAVPELDAAADLIKTVCFRMQAEERAEGGWSAKYWADQLHLVSNAIAQRIDDIEGAAHGAGWQVRS